MAFFQHSITEKDELPEFNKAGLQKFLLYSYDSGLGWTRKPFTSGYEQVGENIIMFRVNQRGSRLNPEYENLKTKMAIYGDSFALSREVKDDETIAHYLSELSNSNVLNFGVGNYGLDQSFLRMKREYPKNKTEIVIVGFVPEQIVRVVSYWMHYFEYGNHFGFKPRFKLRNNELRLIPNIMDSEEKFNRLEELIPKIKENDYWYEKKFKKDIGIDYKNEEGRRESDLKWRIDSYKDEECLRTLLGIIDLFKKYSEEQGFKLLIAVLPYKNDLLHIKKEGKHFYKEFIEKCKDKVEIIDLAPYFLELDENRLNSYFSHNTEYGGHYSKEGNKFVADILYEKIK